MPTPSTKAKQTVGNPEWRLRHLYHIVDKRSQKILLRPNPIQLRVRNEPSLRKKILKSRQVGISTDCIITLFDRTIWNRNQTSCILSHEQDSIEKLFRIVRRAYEFMDPRFRPRLDRGGGSKYEFYFPDLNSRIYCDLESRSDTIHNLHVSEAAFMKDPARLMATLQAVPFETGRVTIETTANGMGNHFYDFWVDEDERYAKLFFPWFLMPEYTLETRALELTQEETDLVTLAWKRYGIRLTYGQIAFRRMKKAELKGFFIQEYPEDDISCFLASGAAAMDLQVVKELYDKAPEPLRVEMNGALKIFKEPGRGPYVIGADTAEGVGGDASCASVMDVSTLEEVATLWGNKWKPSVFAKHLYDLGERYQAGGMFPLLAVERNNHGHAVLQELDEDHLGYPNLYHRILDPQTEERDERPGWVTDKVTRPIMIDAYIDGVENKTAHIKDRQTLAECLTLVTNDSGKIEAAEGKHDDRVIAGAITLQLATQEGRTLRVYTDIGSKIRV
jgi:hypothetical protein